MAENKGKSGAGKFFLGALLGAAAGAIAGRFVSAKAEKDDEEELDERCDCCPACEGKEVAREEAIKEKKSTKKEKE